MEKEAGWLIALSLATIGIVVSLGSMDEQFSFYFSYGKAALVVISFFMGTLLPGRIGVNRHGIGVIIRIITGFSLAASVFLFTSNKISSPSLTLSIPDVIDFRTELSSEYSIKERMDAPLAVTVPINLRSNKKGADTVFIINERVVINIPNEEALNFHWMYFVNQVPTEGDWLSVEKAVADRKIQINAGDVENHETLYFPDGYPNNAISWKKFIRLLNENLSSEINAELIMTLNDKLSLSKKCVFIPSNHPKTMAAAIKDNAFRLTVTCINKQ